MSVPEVSSVPGVTVVDGPSIQGGLVSEGSTEEEPPATVPPSPGTPEFQVRCCVALFIGKCWCCRVGPGDDEGAAPVSKLPRLSPPSAEGVPLRRI